MADAEVLSQFVDETEEEAPRKKSKPQKVSNQELEKLYDQSSARILQERNDFFLPQIRDFISKKQLVMLRPEYQRRDRWDAKKQSRLIESLLMNVPVPPVFFYERELNRYEVMDGQQRLAAILEFYNGKLVLKGLSAWSDLNGRKYRDLPSKLQRGLDRRRISAVILLAESAAPQQIGSGDIRREVFSRLNTGGTALNNQELRNCLYAGPFNNLIISLSAMPQFRRMWDIPVVKGNRISTELRENKLFQAMGDCQIVLRFFAFRNKKKIKGSVKRMLDQCMIDNKEISPGDVKTFKADFSTRLNLIHEIFGQSAFLLPKRFGNRHSRPLFDALMVAADRQWSNKNTLLKKRTALRKGLSNMLHRRGTYALIVGRPNTADAVKARIDLAEKIFRAATR
jgi:Protein of unknown function DUF262